MIQLFKKCRIAILVLISLMAVPLFAAVDVGHTFRTEHASVSLSTEPSHYVAGKELKAEVTLTSIPGWHTYYKTPGDVGLPTRIQWTLPEGVTAGEILWPEPKRFTQSNLVSFGYEGTVVLTIPLSISANYKGDVPLQAKIKWLVCAEQCVPEEANLKLNILPTDASSDALGGLFTAILFAFVGGLLLNLMPCVLPVLSIKVFALLGERNAPRRQLALHGLVFLLGVLASFWVLAGTLLVLQSAGAAIGWGFQLQSPSFVVSLAALFTLLGLNFLGVFEMGTSLQGVAGEFEQQTSRGTSALFSSFSSGVLTTLVATPCTAPFLGAGIGFTLGQSPIYSMMIFSAMGLGVGLPVTLLALSPGWLKYIPRPGAWMLVMKQIFAFPMFLTVVWLCWVLGHQRGVDAMALLLIGLIFISLSAWLWGRNQHRVARSFAQKIRQMALPGLCLILGGWIAWPNSFGMHSQQNQIPDLLQNQIQSRAQLGSEFTTEKPKTGEKTQTGVWLPYSETLLNEARHQGHPVFVDFTAAWCLSCQVNKRATLHATSVVEAFKQQNVITIEADWTNGDPVVTAALARLQRNAVPVYAVYPANGGPPELLPEVLTPSLVIQALNRAAQKDTPK